MLSPDRKVTCPVDSSQESGRHEKQRLKAMAELGLMDVESIPIFEEATQTAAHLLNAPICILGLMDHERQWFKSAIGLSRIGLMNDLAASRQLPRQDTFCASVVAAHRVLVINDAAADPIYAESVLVQRYGIRAYMGAPLITSAGFCIGTLAIMDLVPCNFSYKDIEILELIARWCMSEYERNHLRKQGLGASSLQAGATTQIAPVSTVKASLMSQMAQELRTPLTSILGMASVLIREIYGPLTGKQKEYLDIIHNSGQHLLTVLTEMLDLGALSEHNYSLNLSPVDVEMLGQQALSALEQVAARRQQQLRLTLEPGNRIWLLDKDKTRQMMYHLVFGIIQLASNDSTIRIHISRRQNHLNVTISASHPWLGDGLVHLEPENSPVGWSPAASLDAAILPPLVEIQSPRAESYSDGASAESLSSGEDSIGLPSRQNLGLTLSRQLAEMHGGRISIQGSTETGYRYVVSIPQISDVDSMEG